MNKKAFEFDDAEELLLEFETVIHEFNNKLTVLAGGCDFIKDDQGLTEQNKKMLKLVVESCREFRTQCMETVEAINIYFEKKRAGKMNKDGGLPESA